MSRVEEYRDLLSLLSRAKTKNEIEQLLKVCTKDFILLISEVALNVLNGRIPLSEGQTRELSKHRHTIRFLRNKRTSPKRRKARLLTGKGLGFLFPALFPLIAGVLSNGG